MAITRGLADGAWASRVIEVADRFELLYLFVCVAAALVVLVHGFRQLTSPTARRQLRWIFWGTALGVGPFALGYALPWAIGIDPPLALQLTAIPLGLVPLTFASAIVRYRLRDVEVIIKRGFAYTAFVAATVALGLAIFKLTSFAFPLEPIARTGSSRFSRPLSSSCSRNPSRKRCRTRSIGCSTATGTTIAGRWLRSPAI